MNMNRPDALVPCLPSCPSTSTAAPDSTSPVSASVILPLMVPCCAWTAMGEIPTANAKDNEVTNLDPKLMRLHPRLWVRSGPVNAQPEPPLRFVQ